MPKLSVIIPVYNTIPEFIEEAVSSVLNQTFKDIEIVVVNDGSTNIETLEYLQSLEKRNIKVVSQQNKGLGGARNTGIENSSGEFLGFLDSDDWLDEDFYEKLLESQEKEQSDMVCGVLTFADGEIQFNIEDLKNVTLTKVHKIMKFINNGSVCTKIFRRKLFDGIRFDEKLYYEDNPVLVELILKCNKVTFTNKVHYYYRKTSDSITNDPAKVEKRYMDSIKILKRIKQSAKDLSSRDRNSIMDVFFKILFSKNMYKNHPTYKNEIDTIFGKNYYSNVRKREEFERIFSIKSDITNTRTIITAFGIRIKIRRKNSEFGTTKTK